MENKILTFNILLFFSLIVSFSIYKSAYIKGKLTCNNYILNSYLYILLSLLIVSSGVILLEKWNKNLFFFRSRSTFWILLFFSLGTLMTTMFTDSRNTMLKHSFWFVLMMFFSVIVFPVYLLTKKTNTLQSTLGTLFIMVASLTAIAFYNPDLISLSLGPVLLIFLLGGIVLSIMNMLLSSKKTFTKYHNILSYLFIVLFSVFILYDTKKLQVNAKKCVIPDYINESLGIFLDIMNLFVRLGWLGARR